MVTKEVKCSDLITPCFLFLPFPVIVTEDEVIFHLQDPPLLDLFGSEDSCKPSTTRSLVS